MHDFSTATASKGGGGGALKYLAALAVLALLAAGTMYYVKTVNLVRPNVLVNEDSAQIVLTKTFQDHIETTTVDFEDIEKLQLVMGAGRFTWEVAVVDRSGTRHIINESDSPLGSYVETVSKIIGKKRDRPVEIEEIKKLKGFGD
jgi:hypothetical protein